MRFARDYSQWNVELNVCDQLEDAISDADIINLATRSDTGLFSVEQIKSDVHINAVGAYQPSMKEVSNDVIEASSMVIVDDLVGSHHEAGDLIQAHETSDCAWTWDDLNGDLQALVTGKLTEVLSEKNTNNTEQAITLFKSVGAASFDAAVAVYITQLAREKNLGIALS